MNANDERLNELEIACARLIIERDTARCDLYEAEKRLGNAERILRDYGLMRCDIPACNCNSYHQETPEPEV